MPLFDFTTQQNPLKMLIIQGVSLYRYNLSAIPFITVPVLGILISYLATVTGFMSPAFIQVPWTTPVFLNAWLATAGDVRAVLVQFIIFALGVLLYIPFIKVNDKVVEQEMEG